MSWRSKTFDEVPALSVRRKDLRSALRIVTAGYMLFTLFFACTSGSHVRIFLIMLGFDDLTFGLLSAIPFVATFVQLAAAILIEKRGLKKHQFIQCAIWHRALWLFIAAIPFFIPNLPSSVAIVLMLCFLGCSAALASLAIPAWMIWMGDLIPRRIRGRYLGQRSRLGAAVRIPLVIALGIMVDALLVRNIDGSVTETASVQRTLLWVTCAVFVVGAVLGMIDVMLFYRIREVLPTVPDKARKPAIDIHISKPDKVGIAGRFIYAGRYVHEVWRQLIIDPVRDRAFRRFVLHGATITFALTVSGWYFWRNAVRNLGFSNLATNVMFLVCGPVAGMVAAKGWGRLIDRWGRRPVLVLATSMVVFSVMPWFFVTRYTPAPAFLVDSANWLSTTIGSLFGYSGWLIAPEGAPVGAYLIGILACCIGGASWTGVEMARTGIAFGFADGHGRSKYVAASGALISIGGILGGICGGLLTSSLSRLRLDPIVVGPFLWNHWHAAMAVSLLARMLAVFWAIGMPDPGSGKVSDMIRLIRSNVYNNVRTRVFYIQRIFGWRNNRPNRWPDDRDSRGDT